MQPAGIHHLTAISARLRENLAFYTGLLGMRLVKKTVHQDDNSAYRRFYAGGKASRLGDYAGHGAHAYVFAMQDALGGKLAPPPCFELRGAAIEAGLKPFT